MSSPGSLDPFATVGFWKPTVVTVGAITMILGAWRALSQRDLKVLLAHGTVSQLGFMVVLFGIGGTETTQAGVALLIGHCLFKAALFMSVGVIDKGTGTRNVDELQRLWPRMRVTVPVTVVAAASMAGVPPFVGFIAKESAIGALFDDRTILSVSALDGSGRRFGIDRWLQCADYRSCLRSVL
ncbi:MAG: proton-conducting transporter membrane subunit [Microthrixaceae bacterium]